MPWWKRKLSRSAGTLATGKKTWHTQYENHSQVLRSVYVSGISRFMLVMFFWLEYTIYIHMFVLLDSWFLSRNDTNGRVFAETCYQCQRTRATHRNVETAQAQVQELQKKLGDPCGCSAQCLMQPVYSVQVAHLDPWLPKHPWRCGCQTATESTHVSNQKLQPPWGAALQIQWSKYPFSKVYWITVFFEDNIS